MAKVYRNVGLNFANLPDELEAFYHSAVTVYYLSENFRTIVFSFSFIPGKVFKLVIYENSYNKFMGGWLGDYWLTEDEISNPLQFKGTSTSSAGSSAAIQGIECVFGPDTFILAFQSKRGVGEGNETVILDKLTTGEYGIFGINGITTVNNGSRGYNLTTMEQFSIRTHGYSDCLINGKVILQDIPLCLGAITLNASMYADANNNLITFENVKISSYAQVPNNHFLITAAGVFLSMALNMEGGSNTGLPMNMYVSFS